MANISIGEVSQRTGLAVSAIRYYQEMGLVHPSRTSGGRRVFMRSDIRRLSFVIISQQLGFSIADIRNALALLPDGRTPNKADWTRLSHAFRTDIEARIAGLTELRDRLDGCIGCGCLSLQDCKLHNPNDKAAASGSGPRFVLGDRPLDD
ncbi:MAG: redox-sensitive transcriptional activator SoxR [Alphaproteobacteria bacterium]|nr:redox-sensitive transcriptional activator SoxR [Alphaproteobacteria bacterium]